MNGILYNSAFVASASYFAVQTFLLLSGISSRMAYENGSDKGIIYQLKRIGRFFGQYAIATAILQIWYLKSWDYKTYISYLLNFNITGPYYFFVFFFQFLLISPFLLKWCKFCGLHKKRYIWHIGTLILLGYVSSLCIRYTYVLPVHGGGQYLFGGTWLILYYLGMVLEDIRVFYKTAKQRFFILAVSSIMWIVWWWCIACDILPFDHYMEAYWGAGSNPPSIKFMFFGIVSLFVLYGFFSLLDESHNKFIITIVKGLSFLGRYTIYTFMYHLLVRDILFTITPLANYSYIVKWICVYVPMIILPVLLTVTIKKVKSKLTSCIDLTISAAKEIGG